MNCPSFLVHCHKEVRKTTEIETLLPQNLFFSKIYHYRLQELIFAVLRSMAISESILKKCIHFI